MDDDIDDAFLYGDNDQSVAEQSNVDRSSTNLTTADRVLSESWTRDKHLEPFADSVTLLKPTSSEYDLYSVRF